MTRRSFIRSIFIAAAAPALFLPRDPRHYVWRPAPVMAKNGPGDFAVTADSDKTVFALWVQDNEGEWRMASFEGTMEELAQKVCKPGIVSMRVHYSNDDLTHTVRYFPPSASPPWPASKVQRLPPDVFAPRDR